MPARSSHVIRRYLKKRLFDDDRLAGTTISRLLASVFVFGGHGTDLDRDHAVTHLEHLGTNVDADFARCAERLVNTNLHFVGPLKTEEKTGLEINSGPLTAGRSSRNSTAQNTQRGEFVSGPPRYESSTVQGGRLEGSRAVCGSAQLRSDGQGLRPQHGRPAIARKSSTTSMPAEVNPPLPRPGSRFRLRRRATMAATITMLKHRARYWELMDGGVVNGHLQRGAGQELPAAGLRSIARPGFL